MRTWVFKLSSRSSAIESWRKAQGEDRALGPRRLHRDGSAMHLHHPLAQREAEACSRAGQCFQPHEVVEDALPRLGWNADAVVLHLERRSVEREGDLDGRARVVLARVAQEVEQAELHELCVRLQRALEALEGEPRLRSVLTQRRLERRELKGPELRSPPP